MRQVDTIAALSAKLDAIHDLTWAADKLMYFTSASAVATTTVTSYARTLLDDANDTAARSTLGLGSMATQVSSNVTITGGNISGITDLAVVDGGTGASTAANAATNLGLGTGSNVTHASLVLGTDPTGSEPLRVGGSAVVSGTVKSTASGKAFELLGQVGGPSYITIDQTANSGKVWRLGNTGAVDYTSIDLYNQTDSTIAFSVSATGVASFKNTTDATDKDTGSIVTDGGFAAEKDIFAGGRVRHTGCYAEIHVHDASTAQSINNGTTYTKLTAFTDNGSAANCTADAANDKITLTKAGKYRVSWHMSFTCGTNNVVWKVAAFLDSTELDDCHAQTKIGTAGDSQHVSAMAILTTTANKDLDLRARHDQGGATNITPVYANLNVDYLGE